MIASGPKNWAEDQQNSQKKSETMLVTDDFNDQNLTGAH